MVKAEYIIKNTEENIIHRVHHVWLVKSQKYTSFCLLLVNASETV